mgnify:CR=1 FL=1
MDSKEQLLKLRLKREAFFQQYVNARIKWISMSVTPSLEPSQRKKNSLNGAYAGDAFTLYERVE